MKLTVSRPSARRVPSAADVWFTAVTICLSACVVATMLVIYALSAESPEDSGDRSNVVTDVVVDVVYPDLQERPPAEQQSLLARLQSFIRKLAHFAEFALLGFLSALLVRHIATRLPALRWWLRWSITALFCLFYAISDEVHQIFSNRGPAVKDVLIDFAGAVAGLTVGFALMWLIYRIARSVTKRRAARGAA